jgi:hypothetical protein
MRIEAMTELISHHTTAASLAGSERAAESFWMAVS